MWLAISIRSMSMRLFLDFIELALPLIIFLPEDASFIRPIIKR
jgi:hypothetical protein